MARKKDPREVDAARTGHAIDTNEYQTGLAFNPDGYRSYYVALRVPPENSGAISRSDAVRARQALSP